MHIAVFGTDIGLDGAGQVVVVLHATGLHCNPYDGYTLGPVAAERE